MPTVIRQATRQAILVADNPIDPGLYPEKLELFDADHNPVVVGGFEQRDTLVHTSGSLAPGVTENSVLTAFPGWRITKIVTNRPARIRMYVTSAHRTLDVNRTMYIDPPIAQDHGLLFEAITASPSPLAFSLTPTVDLASSAFDVSDYYMAVTNLDSATGTVITTYTYIRTE